MSKGIMHGTDKNSERMIMEAHGLKTFKALRKFRKSFLKKAPICEVCNGKGGKPDSITKGIWIKCNNCKGRGKVL